MTLRTHLTITSHLTTCTLPDRHARAREVDTTCGMYDGRTSTSDRSAVDCARCRALDALHSRAD